MSERKQVAAEIAIRRQGLDAPLDELDDALNLKKQSQRVAERMTALYQQNPTPWWIGAGVVAVAAVSAVAWALFGDD